MNKKSILRLGVGTAVWIFAMFVFQRNIKIFLYLLSYLVIGYPVLFKAIKNIFSGNILDENFLMIAASIGAICLKEYTEAVAVVLFYGVGELFEKYAVTKSRKEVLKLMGLRPDYANKVENGSVVMLSPEEVNVGDVLVIKPGEKIPLDGVVVSGKTTVDTKAITGEPAPVALCEGDDVLSGCINLSGVIKVRTTKSFGQSTAAKILELVEIAASKKAVHEKFITKFAKYYTPLVVLCAILIAVIPVLLGQSVYVWVKRGLLFLVVSCPCALAISVPLAFFSAVGGASKKGILIKGGGVIETLAKVKNAVFDKTGTLTEGVFKIIQINAVGTDSNKLLEYAAVAESFSGHPIAVSLKKAYNKEIDISFVKKCDEIAGLGVISSTSDGKIYAGNSKLMKMAGIDVDDAQDFGTVVHISFDDKYLGYIVISDVIKKDARGALDRLKSIGITKTAMLTGDREKSAIKVARDVGVDEVHFGLLPEDKIKKLEEIMSKGCTLYAGDGINDAPVLMRADVGVGMGLNGTDAAMEAADVVLMEDNPLKIAEAIKLSRKTIKIVIINIIFALSVKFMVMILGASGLAGMWAAVFADVGVSVVAIFNSIRTLK